jgi:hypothetical protein
VSNYHLVIRTAGERTESVATRLARFQSRDSDGISIICQAPFESALRASYEAGIRAGKTWTVTLDADVLLRKDAISGLLEHAQHMPTNYLQLEGRVFDKILGTYRQAGHRVYRTELLRKAIGQIPEPGSQIRPEYFTIAEMGRLGHPTRHVGRIVGLHDFEQNYCDLYRKAMVHSRKHASLVAGLIERCAERLHGDADFLVILKGLWDGLTTKASLTIDHRAFVDRAARALDELGIREKGRIEDEDRFLVEDLAPMFGRIASEQRASDIPVVDEPRAPDAADPGWVGKARQRISKHGWTRGCTASVGALLKLVGDRLDR